jgi:PKD domain
MHALRSTFAAAALIAFMAIVACSGGESAPDTTTPNPLVADAGPDQSVFVGILVTLNGSKSTNANQTGLTYKWTLDKPTGSNASLSNDTSATPTLTADVEGTYEATLIVTDARQANLSSAPDSVLVTAAKSDPPPTADPGKNQDVFVNRPVTLDGSGSRASGNKQLTFDWSFKKRPTGSAATLSDPTRVNPSFTPDQSGSYVLQLIVNDGTKSSTPAEVTITAAVKPRPTADAGSPQSTKPGTPITLDGSKSTSATPDPPKFTWSLHTIPDGGKATLTNNTTKFPTFTAEVARIEPYVVQLIVNDGTDDSEPVTVNITVTADAPVANAGAANQTASVCHEVPLDGSGSTDRDGPPITLSYNWTVSPEPTNATAKLKNGATVSASFIPELPITYQATLTVKEGDLQSAPASVNVTASSIYNGGSVPNTADCMGSTCHDVGGTGGSLSKEGLKVLSVLQDKPDKHQRPNVIMLLREQIKREDFCTYFQEN